MGLGRFLCFCSGKKESRDDQQPAVNARALDGGHPFMSDKQPPPQHQPPASHITTIHEPPPPAYGAPAAPYGPVAPYGLAAPYSPAAPYGPQLVPGVQPSPSNPYPSNSYNTPYYSHSQPSNPGFSHPPMPMATPPAPSSPPIEPITRRFSSRANSSVGADHYSALRNFDTVFLIDDSGSMLGPNWRQTSAALEAIVPICTTHDADGVDIYFLNHPQAHTQIRSAAEVLSIFGSVRPCGATPTGRRLGEILELYLAAYRRNRTIKPLNIIVITDGEPSDPGRLKKCIVDCAKSLDELGATDRQVGVQFFQVGNDEAATESLEELDNELVEVEGVRDMVDTISWRKMNEGKGLSADGILKAVMGAVDKKLDRTQRA